MNKSDNLPLLRNPDILLGENDLTSLSYLHEPAGMLLSAARNKKNAYINVWIGII